MSSLIHARHPTLDECHAAGRGPDYYPVEGRENAVETNTPEERARFEAYMRGHCWDAGTYLEEQGGYDTMFARAVYGVWRDRGRLPTVYGLDESSNTASKDHHHG